MRAFQKDHVPRPILNAEFNQWVKLGPFDLEIGAGRGLHAITYCKNNPARRLLALERTQNKFDGLLHRQTHHSELTNLFVLNADAVSVVSHFLQYESIQRVFLLYPNPYPKPKQANLRWHNSPFMAELLAKMHPWAQLHLATNLEWYAREAIEKFQKNWSLNLIAQKKLDSTFTGRTHFEKKYLQRGETCFDMIFGRQQNEHRTSLSCKAERQ